jgi:hypothetical protein
VAAGTERRGGEASDVMAEGVGFEPTDPCGSTVFKTVAIVHSATPPVNVADADESSTGPRPSWPGALLNGPRDDTARGATGGVAGDSDDTARDTI